MGDAREALEALEAVMDDMGSTPGVLIGRWLADLGPVITFLRRPPPAASAGARETAEEIVERLRKPPTSPCVGGEEHYIGHLICRGCLIDVIATALTAEQQKRRELEDVVVAYCHTKSGPGIAAQVGSLMNAADRIRASRAGENSNG